MSPTQEAFEGATPDFVGEAYGGEQAAEVHGEGSVAGSLPNSDLLSEIARLSTRLDEFEARQEEPARLPPAAYETPLRGARPVYGYGEPAVQQRLSANYLGGGGRFSANTPGYFARRSGVYGPGAQAWIQQLEEQYQREYQQQFARGREQLQQQFQHEYLMQRQGLQQQYDHEVQNGAQGIEELRAEVARLREANRQLHEQLMARAPDGPMTHEEMGMLNPNVVKVPSATQAKLSQELFDGTEVYKGLGTGFTQWGRQFLVKIDLAEQACGFRWPEIYKVSRFGEFVRGKAVRYFNSRIDGWWNAHPTLGQVMDKMVDAYRIVYSRKQTIELFSERKDRRRSWNDHLLYLKALSEATKGGDELILENLVKHAAPESKALIMGQYDPRRMDHLTHAKEIVMFIQGIKDETVDDRSTGREIVNAITETRTCHNCGQVGHMRRDCGAPKRDKPLPGNNVRWALHVSDGNLENDDWILDTGASCHLVRDASMLYESERCESKEDCVCSGATPSLLRVLAQKKLPLAS